MKARHISFVWVGRSAISTRVLQFHHLAWLGQAHFRRLYHVAQACLPLSEPHLAHSSFASGPVLSPHIKVQERC